MDKPLEKEFRYYLAHQDELLEKFRDRVVVIKNEKIIGDYSTETQAIEETVKKHELGTFLVQKVAIGSDTQIFHSRVVFA